MQLLRLLKSLKLAGFACLLRLLMVLVVYVASVRSLPVLPIILFSVKFSGAIVLAAVVSKRALVCWTDAATACTGHTDAKPCAVTHMSFVSCRSQVVFTNNPEKSVAKKLMN